MKIEKLNNRIKEEVLENELKNFTKEYLIRLLLYHGCVENTVNKLIADFEPQGTTFNNVKDLLKQNVVLPQADVIKSVCFRCNVNRREVGTRYCISCLDIMKQTVL